MKKRILTNFIIYTSLVILFRYLTEDAFETKMIYSSLIAGIIFTGLMTILQGDKLNNIK